jgi:hypothetical protein
MPQTSIYTHGCRISDEWTLRGMRAAVIENELLRVLVLLDKGAEILEFCYKPLGLSVVRQVDAVCALRDLLTPDS